MLPPLRALGQRLRESLWFVPGLLVLGAFALAYGLIAFDTRTSFDGGKQFPLLFGAGAEGSRGMLTAIAGSMLTVAALVFSLTLSTISQVSSQYSPRVLRNFMRDRGNQVVMGYFVAVFAYCLIVLGTIRSAEERKFVPSTAVLVGLMLALGGVAALIYFIHHIAESLQTGTILRRISRETSRAIDQLFPQKLGEPVAPPQALPAERPGPAVPLEATTTGYVQHFDADRLLRWAQDHDVFVRLVQPVGALVGEQDLLSQVWPDAAGAPLPDAAALAELRAGVVLVPHRSIEQDVAFGLQ